MDDLSIAQGFLSCVLRKKIYNLNFLPKDRNGIIPENGNRKRKAEKEKINMILELNKNDISIHIKEVNNINNNCVYLCSSVNWLYIITLLFFLGRFKR